MATVPPVKSGYIGNGPKVRLNYLEWGDPDAPPVVLIIGLTAQAYNWRTTAEALKDRYRVIALNLRGHGDSSPFPNRTPNSPGDDRWGDWASDVHALVQELGLKKPVVMGHSLGARVAYCYAAYYPDEPRSIVVIDNGPGFPPMVALNVQHSFMRNRLMEFDGWPEAIAYFKTRRGTSPGGPKAIPVPEEEYEARADYALKQLPDGKVIWKFDPILRDEWMQGADTGQLAYRATVQSWLWREVSQVECPMLLVVGETSKFQTPETCDKMVKMTWGPARWVMIPHAGHSLMDDNLEGWLSEVEPFLAESFAS
jgi:pimeloyl-ACP methyl ester carboxylesterase